MLDMLPVRYRTVERRKFSEISKDCCGFNKIAHRQVIMSILEKEGAKFRLIDNGIGNCTCITRRNPYRVEGT